MSAVRSTSLLQHAINSLELGIQDAKAADPRRVSSAVRNLYAGLLLLLKEKLAQESPNDDVLIYTKFTWVRDGQGNVVAKPCGKNTIDTQEIVERYKSLNLSLDASRIHDLQQIRNAIEHREPAHPEATIRAAIAKTFVLITAVIKDHLGKRQAERDPELPLSQPAERPDLCQRRREGRLPRRVHPRDPPSRAAARGHHVPYP